MASLCERPGGWGGRRAGWLAGPPLGLVIAWLAGWLATGWLFVLSPVLPLLLLCLPLPSLSLVCLPLLYLPLLSLLVIALFAVLPLLCLPAVALFVSAVFAVALFACRRSLPLLS